MQHHVACCNPSGERVLDSPPNTGGALLFANICYNPELPPFPAVTFSALDNLAAMPAVIFRFALSANRLRSTWRPLDFPSSRGRYGSGLMNWVLYQNIIGGQSVLRISKSCGELYCLDVGQQACHRFKVTLAKRYRPTADAIRDELMQGASLHVDETEVKLGMDKAYVWVFAGPCGAHYEYRESRNGQFLAERIQGFSGVLVTDFFTAYDSLDCPQQKCLIHLIRDMNEDLRLHPFDEELKHVVQRFASVLRPIIGSVDQHGLSKRHLQKHKSPAMKFIETVQAEGMSSAASIKYQQRISKYGYRLFTFLDHDNVPWNNNNAEHAIHTFARYRRFADAKFTEKSLAEFLTLLTVCQSCEYRDENVLRFLLSGAERLTPMQPLIGNVGSGQTVPNTGEPKGERSSSVTS
jgi:hypothetical protein